MGAGRKSSSAKPVGAEIAAGDTIRSLGAGNGVAI